MIVYLHICFSMNEILLITMRKTNVNHNLSPKLFLGCSKIILGCSKNVWDGLKYLRIGSKINFQLWKVVWGPGQNYCEQYKSFWSNKPIWSKERPNSLKIGWHLIWKMNFYIALIHLTHPTWLIPDSFVPSKWNL